jgi:DNA-binding SARP family transcriptional activator
MEFRVLGPLEVLDDEGRPVALGGQRQRAVLALLLLNRGAVVSTDRLLDAVWGEQPPRTATTSLQNFVSQLRKLLGPDRIATKPPGYIVSVQRDEVDVDRFVRLLEQARDVEPAERSRRLHEALALWRGPALGDFAYEAFARPDIERLEELRLTALEERIAADLELGRDAELIGELETLVDQSPLRERLRSHLMLALYRAGRQGDALNAYEDARRTLVGELGIDPSPALRQLHSSILRQERSLEPARQHRAEDGLADAAAALLAGRLVPVLGVEVSELAARLAERFDYPTGDGRELTRVAQYVTLMQGSGPLYDELHALLGTDAVPTTIHRFFAALPRLLRERGLPHQLIVTTGYDLALEQAFLDAGEEFDVVSYLATGAARGRFCHFAPDGAVRVIDVPNTYATELSLARRTVILKLHGGLDLTSEREWESFVVTEDDYIDYLSGTDVAAAVPVALTAKVRRSHLLFLGYGMREWNLRVVLSRVWGGGAVSYRSWAVLPDPAPIERQFWRARGVDVVDAPLADYVGALSRYVGLPATAPA